MSRKLTAKQESAAQLVAGGWTKIDAYRHCYNVSDTASDNSVQVDSSRLFANPIVSLRIQELQVASSAALAEKRLWTLDRLVDEAETNLDKARLFHQMGSANGSLELIGRATGLLSDKQQGVTAPVTQIVINLAPGVEMPHTASSEVVEATEYRDVSEEGYESPAAPITESDTLEGEDDGHGGS